MAINLTVARAASSLEECGDVHNERSAPRRGRQQGSALRSEA